MCFFRLLVSRHPDHPNTIRFFGTNHARNASLFSLACLAVGGFDEEAAPGFGGGADVPALVPGVLIGGTDETEASLMSGTRAVDWSGRPGFGEPDGRRRGGAARRGLAAATGWRPAGRPR
jgi:hypothetical protein